MAANLLPITSDGGFTSGGNINSSGDPSAAPSLNDFFSITSAANFAIVTDNANTDQTWTFDDAGNLTLPGNTFAVNYANGTQVSIGGGSGNTGNVTFDDNIVIGTGDEFGSTGLFLAPGNGSIANSAVQYLRVRGGDAPTHIHLDTGNNQFYDQYFGDDAKYVKLELGDAGNVVIGTDDANGNQYSWSFTSDGNLILAGGDSVIQSIANSSLDPVNPNVSTMIFTPDQGYSSQSLVLDPTAPGHIHLRAPGANIDEPLANIFLGGEDSSFEVGYYNGAAPNLFVHSGGNTWTFDTAGNLTTPSNLVIGTGAGSGSRIFQYDDGLEIVGEGANSVVLMGWTANISAPDSVATIAMNYPSGGEGNILFAVGNNATTVNYWLFDNTGNTTFPRDTGPNTTDPILTIVGGGNPSISSIDASLAGPANLGISALTTTFTGFTGDAIKIYPDDGEISSTANLQIWANSGGNTEYSWTFDTTGNLTLPLGSIVYETNIPDGALSGSAIALKPIGGTTANQQLLIYPTAADGDHIHMTSGNLYATELFLGSDNLYVKLANTGNVVINSNDGNSSNAMWTFDTDGNLTLPGNLVINGLTNVFGSNVALLQSNPDLPLLSVSSGSNGGVSSLWVEDIGNTGTSNIAAVYANPTVGSKIVRIVVGQNGVGSGPNLWDFNANGTTTFPGGLIGSGASPAPYISGFDSISSITLSASGNVTGDYILGNGSGLTSLPAPTVAQDITSNGAMSIMTYDGNLKYVNNATVEPSTGNIAGGNISTTGAVTANTANITTGNITTINSGLLQNGNSNITITSNGNVSIQAAGSNVELVVTSTGANVNGTLDVTGNITGANLVAGSSGLGNVYAGNVIVNGQPTTYGVANLTTGVVAIQATATGTVAATVVANTSPNGSTCSSGSNTSPGLTVLTVAIPTAGTWRLDAELRVDLSSGGYMAAAFYDNGTLIPGSEYWVAGGAQNKASGSGSGQYSGFMSYNVTTTAARTVTLGIWSTATTSVINSGDGRTWMRATQLDSIFALNTLDTMSATGNISANNFIGNGGGLSNVATKTTGSWTLAAGTNTVSISVPLNGTYSIWVNGNIPNGIITYTATAVVTNTNVPVLGEQYGWYYAVGNALVLTSIPNQFTGTVGSISNVNTYLGNTANVFTFGITNNSGNTAVVNYGYTKL